MAIGNLNYAIRFREALIPTVPIIHYGRLASQYGERPSARGIQMETSSMILFILTLASEAFITLGAIALAKENLALGLFAYGAGKAALAGGVTYLER